MISQTWLAEWQEYIVFFTILGLVIINSCRAMSQCGREMKKLKEEKNELTQLILAFLKQQLNITRSKDKPEQETEQGNRTKNH